MPSSRIYVYIYRKGLFINTNTNINELIRINSRIKTEIYKENSISGIYKILNRELQEDIKYELEDIQIVRFEKEKYLFNILSKNIIRVLVESKDDFSKLENQSYSLNGENYNLMNDITKRLLNNENLFTLIHKLIYSKISTPNKYLNEIGIYSTIKINFKMLKGMGYMENKELDMLTKARMAGKNLKEKYESKNAEHKLSGICYRLLNGIKTNNITMTMDTILNCYLYCDEGVPKVIMEMIGNEEEFKEIGYAFISGLLSIKYNDKKDKEVN